MTNSQSPSSRFLPVVVLLFMASGCAALIYEIVWFQLLQLAIGSTAVSLGVLLATYMGGLFLGSLLFPKVNRSEHPLRIYAVLEAGIAVFALLTLVEIPLIQRVYIAAVGYGMPGMMLRGLISAVCLLPPTILMGASLPAIVRWTESTPRGASWWGMLYGGNTIGAVFGCLLAGFYLLRVYNAATGAYVAALINLLVAAASFAVAKRTPKQALDGEPEAAAAPAAAQDEGPNWPVYVTIAISGAGALGLQVIWTRLLGMLLGSTVYVFSIILAVFLIGLALGSWAGSWLLRAAAPRAALGWCQILLAGAIAWSAWIITDSLPFWPINPLLTQNQWHMFQLDMVRCFWAILPPTLLWGASFPLACAAAARRDEDPGRVVGAVYAANTFGAIIGALGASLIMVPAIGTQNSQRLLLIASAVSGLFVLVPYIRRRSSFGNAVALTAGIIVACVLAWNVSPIPGTLVAYGRKAPISGGQVVYVREGRNSSVAITEWPSGSVEVCVNGHVEATTEAFDMKLQRTVGHLPALLHPDPKEVLGIGFGAGVSAGTFTTYPGIKRITVCEIEPVIPPTSTKYFRGQNYGVLYNPKTRIIYDDARHYLMTTRDKYDVIASDPLDVFAKGTAALYSKEYFEAVKNHLNPGGLFSLYVPLYETDERTIRSELATFFDAFPYGTVWANTISGRGYDMTFLGQLEPLKVDLDVLDARLARPDYANVAQSLREIGVFSALDFFTGYAGQKSDLGPWIEGAEINRDSNMRLQYLAGWGINSSLEDVLQRKMWQYKRTPEGMFTGSPQKVQQLLSMIASQ